MQRPRRAQASAVVEAGVWLLIGHKQRNMTGKNGVRRKRLTVRNIAGYGKLSTAKDSLELELSDLSEGVAHQLGEKRATVEGLKSAN